LPAGLGTLSGPTFTAQAADRAGEQLTQVTLSALGKLTVASLPLDLRAASLRDTTDVTPVRASAQKTLTVGTVALPSLLDLLRGLGIDVDALLKQLPQAGLDQLAGLVTDTATGAVKTANDAVDAAQQAIGSGAPAALDSAQSALADATAAKASDVTKLADENGAFSTALADFFAVIDALPAPVPATLSTALAGDGLTPSTTAGDFLALTPTQVSALTSALSAVPGAPTLDALTVAAQAVQAAEKALATASALVDQLQALVDALTQLVTAVTGALTANNDPLASLGDVSAVLRATAGDRPSAHGDVTVGSVHVLGATAPLAQLTGALGTVTATLGDVLASVGIGFTPPTVSVGTPTTRTGHTGSTQEASASVSAVRIGLPSVDLSAVPGLAAAGAPTKLGGGSVALGVLSETAQHTPARAATSQPSTTPNTTPRGSTPTTPTASSSPSLAPTGGRWALAVLGAALVGLALVARRRLLPPA
jgi:hypothetical protein